MAAVSYPGMPYGANWLDDLPAWLKDGQRGFDLRLMSRLGGIRPSRLC
jgi:hypothetical protein